MSDPCGQPVGWVLLAFGFLGQAFFRVDPVFIVGQSTGLFVYCRNLYLIWRKRHWLAASHGA